MAKVAHLENENKELLEQNALFQRERDEAKSELAVRDTLVAGS